MGYGKITKKQQEILDYIKEEILKKGYPPAVREICEAVQLKSTSSVSQYKDKGDIITYALKGKNYNDLCTPATTPIILGLFVMPEEEASWVQWSREELLIKGCMYWADFSKMPKSDHKETVTISIPKGHVVNKEFLLDILERQAKEA